MKKKEPGECSLGCLNYVTPHWDVFDWSTGIKLLTNSVGTLDNHLLMSEGFSAHYYSYELMKALVMF